MVSIIQESHNNIAIAGLHGVTSGKFTLNILSSCSDDPLQSIDFIGTVCDRTLLAVIEHSCTDKTKLHLDVGTHIYELYQNNEHILTNNIIVYKNKI